MLRDGQTGNVDAAIRDQVARLNRAGGTYHKFDLGNGLVIDGDYDMAKYLHHFRLPRRLDGMSVLDVGTAAGYLALECARRGANVTTIDLWERSEALSVACQALGLTVRYLRKSVFELDASFGSFDIVLCGSMLMHLASPLDAIRRIRRFAAGPPSFPQLAQATVPTMTVRSVSSSASTLLTVIIGFIGLSARRRCGKCSSRLASQASSMKLTSLLRASPDGRSIFRPTSLSLQ